MLSSTPWILEPTVFCMRSTFSDMSSCRFCTAAFMSSEAFEAEAEASWYDFLMFLPSSSNCLLKFSFIVRRLKSKELLSVLEMDLAPTSESSMSSFMVPIFSPTSFSRFETLSPTVLSTMSIFVFISDSSVSSFESMPSFTPSICSYVESTFALRFSICSPTLLSIEDTRPSIELSLPSTLSVMLSILLFTPLSRFSTRSFMARS